MGTLPQPSIMIGPNRKVPISPLHRNFHETTNQNTALLYKDEKTSVSISYSQLNSTTNALARVITARGRDKDVNSDGDFVVAVCMQPTHNTVTTLLSIWKAGAAYVPMEPTFPPGRITHILKDAEPCLLIYDETADLEMFKSSGVPAVAFNDLIQESNNASTDDLCDSERLAISTNDSIAIVLYTSGSTGIPKGVRLSYKPICNRLWWQFEQFPFSETESICIWKTAITFVDSVSEIWGPLLNGRTLMILPKEMTRDPQKLVRELAEYKIQRLILVPTLLRSILMYLSLNNGSNPLKHLKNWVCSGEALSKDLAKQFFQYFGDGEFKLANFYGSTEVMGDVTYYVLENSAQIDLYQTIPIGIPVWNCSIHLLDENLQPTAQGTRGQLWVQGASLADAYVKGASKESFQNVLDSNGSTIRLYKTGDYAVIEKGVILYAGRTDSQVKIRGNRVDLQEVERAVNKVAGVDKGVVLCYGVVTGNPEILAFVTLEKDVRIAEHHIESTLKSSLTSYMIPQVIIIESIPLLVNGKVDRQSLLKMYENTNNNDDTSIQLDIDYTGVQNHEMQKAKTLFETVGSVLGRSARGTLSLRAGFYKLGGNSLNSIITITQLREKGYYIQISDFLQADTLGEVLSKLNSSPDYDENYETIFTAESMKDEHREKAIEMIVTSFYEKAELEQFLKDEIDVIDYADCINKCWRKLIDADLSIVLKDASNNLKAVALNFDVLDEPEIEVTGGLQKTMTFLEFIESSVRESITSGKGSIVHSFMMATSEDLTPRENVIAIRCLEEATYNKAKEKGFKGIFTTNTSPLTQQLGTSVLGFKTLLDYQINQYVDGNGIRVFGAATDDMRAVVCWKPVH